MDWKEMLQLSPRDLDDQQKDELCQNMKWLDIDVDDINAIELKTLYKLAQEILKYKDEQVELLATEFDEIARKQGIEEARIIKTLENEIKSLKSSSESRRQTPDTDLIHENETLKLKVKSLKTNMKIQIQELDKLKKDLLNLEEEKKLLQSVQQDTDSQSETSEISEKYQYLTENIKQKNKQISQLLTDIEIVEKENIILKEKMINLRDELNDATNHLTTMTAEISGNKNILYEVSTKINKLTEENLALRNQIEELVQQKEHRENEIDNFTSKLDSKIDELKKILEEKQTEIKELKEENNELKNTISQFTEGENKIPVSVLKEREEQIEELQNKLIEATKEIEHSTVLLNNIYESRKQVVSDSEQKEIVENLKSQLMKSHERCQELQMLADSAEQDAQNQGQQLADLMDQLQKYEDGQYGLADAIKEIQDLKIQISVRDKQIAKIIQESNKLQATSDEIEHENLALREKFGLPLDTPVSKSGIISKQRKQKKLINNLQNQIEILEDEKLQMKVDLQKCKRLISESDQKETPDKTEICEEQIKSFDNIEYEKKVSELSEENEALRKGIHEILDSVREKKGTSSREIKSETLEKLLLVLDARHVSGWYHPAMKLQAEINILQGTNEELRNQLKLSRSEVNKSSELLQITELKLENLQKKVEISTEKTIMVDENLISLTVPPNLSATSAEIISKLNSHLLVVLNEYHGEMETNDKLKTKLESFKQEMNIIRQQVGLLYKQHAEEKKKLIDKQEELQREKENLSQSSNVLQLKLENYLNSGEKENIGTKISNDLISLTRKCLYLEENEKKLSAENSKLKLEMCQARNSVNEYIKDLEISQNELSDKVEILEKTLKDSVPKTKLENTNKLINELTLKHRDLLQNVNNFQENNNVLLYKKEIELLNSEKDKLYFELLQLKSKNYLVEHANDDIVQLTKKLANLELNEMSERQRADHVQNLYELVKDQLTKCEERCLEYGNQNKMLINSNLKLQLAQQELQDKLITSVSQEDYNLLENKLSSFKEEFHNLKNKHDRLKIKHNNIEAEIKTREMLKSAQNMELMNLKHLMIDLQSTSDEKALIARLSTEVILARICESDAKNRLDILTNEMQVAIEERKQKKALFNENFTKWNVIQNRYCVQIRIMEQVINSLRSQYLGSNPLTTQERIVDIFQQIYSDKQAAFNEFQTMQKHKNDIKLLQEQLNIEVKNTLDLKSVLQDRSNNAFEKILEWHKDKNAIQLSEFKHRRNLEVKEQELEQTLKRIKKQDNQLLQIEKELLTTKNNFLSNLPFQNENTTKKIFVDIGTDPLFTETTKTENLKHSTGTQTTLNSNKNEEIISTLENEIKQLKELISLKDNNLQTQENIICDLEKRIETELKEKSNQNIVAENSHHKLKKQINVIDEVDMQEHNALKTSVNELQLIIKQKEETISKYETLLKSVKDEHSLAASRFQEEIKLLQTSLQEQILLYDNLKNARVQSTSKILSNKTAVEQYVNQVHLLENHMEELQTSVSSLNSQLQASRQESVRWRTLADDRLKSVENLRKEFDDQHEEEISTYRNETERYKNENISLKQELSKLRVELSQKNSNNSQEIKEKDAKIHELTMTVMQLKNELKICKEDEKIELFPEYSELELAKQLLETEYESLKKRYEQILNREKSARDEVKNLRAQLIKRPVLAVRNDRNDRSVKEQLQKKIAQLEKDLLDANDKLEREAQLNETRKLKVAEDFSQWEKLKRWQQSAEKFKEKLSSKTEDLEKLQQSYNSAKAIISRLEREKHVLEGKLKMSKTSNVAISSSRSDFLEQENVRLKNEVENLTGKLEMQQYHSGGLGAALLQEKLEAQERKIAVLELSGKGTSEVTAELERLHNTVSSLQKSNLRLEAENLELNLDLKKACGDGPHLKEQIQHLERYIDVLKSEQSEHHVVTSAGDQLQPGNKTLELEKTVLSLKRLVDKLQVENKRLQSRPCSLTSERKVSHEKCQAELKKIREQYTESAQRSTKLEENLTKAQKRIRFLETFIETQQAEKESSSSIELSEVKSQLERKSRLLDKVKILLQKAAIKERFLQDQVEQLSKVAKTEQENDEKNGNNSAEN